MNLRFLFHFLSCLVLSPHVHKYICWTSDWTVLSSFIKCQRPGWSRSFWEGKQFQFVYCLCQVTRPRLQLLQTMLSAVARDKARFPQIWRQFWSTKTFLQLEWVSLEKGWFPGCRGGGCSQAAGHSHPIVLNAVSTFHSKQLCELILNVNTAHCWRGQLGDHCQYGD